MNIIIAHVCILVTEPTLTLGPVTGVGSTATGIIVVAVIGWILLMIVLVIVVAIFIWRRKRRYLKMTVTS